MMSSEIKPADCYGGYETAEQSLATRSRDIRTVAQVIRGGGTPPPSELEKFVEMIGFFKEKMQTEPKIKTLRSVKNLMVIAREIDRQRRSDYVTDHKIAMDRARLELEAERTDILKINTAIRAQQSRMPITVFGQVVGTMPELSDEEETEIDRLISSAESLEEFEVLEAMIGRMGD